MNSSTDWSEVTKKTSLRKPSELTRILSYVDWYISLPVSLLVVALTGLGLHRLLRHLGDQGLVDYVPTSPTRKSVGGAMMSFQALFEPAIEHVIEYQRSGDLTIQTTSEPDLHVDELDDSPERDGT